MLELNQFRHSAFCLKVRMVLLAKYLNYKTIEIKPGIGQLSIFRLTGQKQVPVLVDGEKIITDSSEIIRYLEDKHPEPSLLPKDPKQAAQVHLIEDWADTTLARAVRRTLLTQIIKDPDLRENLLPFEFTSGLLNTINGIIPTRIINNTSKILSPKESKELFQSLLQICKLIQTSEWLISNKITFADISVAAQLSLLRFPESAGKSLADKGCHGFADHPQLQDLFSWRDRIETNLIQAHSLKTKVSVPSNND